MASLERVEDPAETDAVQGYREALARFDRASDALFEAHRRNAKAHPARRYPAFVIPSETVEVWFARDDLGGAEQKLVRAQRRVLGVAPRDRIAIADAESAVEVAKQALAAAEKRAGAVVQEKREAKAVLSTATKDVESARRGLAEKRKALVGLVRRLGTELRDSEAAVSAMRAVVAALGDISDTLKARSSAVRDKEGADLDRRFQPLVRDYARVDELLTDELGELGRVRDEATGLLHAAAAPRVTLRQPAEADLVRRGRTVTEGNGRSETPER